MKIDWIVYITHFFIYYLLFESNDKTDGYIKSQAVAFLMRIFWYDQ